jgi:hypothetical protein
MIPLSGAPLDEPPLELPLDVAPLEPEAIPVLPLDVVMPLLLPLAPELLPLAPELVEPEEPEDIPSLDEQALDAPTSAVDKMVADTKSLLRMIQ